MKEKPDKYENKYENGCPCGAFGKCCKDASMDQTITPEHTCSGEDVCEDCYILQCTACGKSCSHEL